MVVGVVTGWPLGVVACWRGVAGEDLGVLI
jgi:hypothetical protein